MPALRTILRRRRDSREIARRSVESRTQRFAIGFGFVFSILMALLILSITVFYSDLTRNLPPVEILPKLLNPPDGLLLQPTRIYDRTDKKILKTFAPTESPRRYIPIDSQNPQHLPESLVQATVVTADPTFWEHFGYTLIGLENPELHPTIAQQLVSDLLLWGEISSTRRAFRERLLAAQITSEYGRSQVIEWYLNSANYGNYAYGANAAAQLYFGKSADALTPAESAVLAGVSQTPSLNPLDAPQAALQRGREIIHIMEVLGFLSEEETLEILAESLEFTNPPEEKNEVATAYLGLVLQDLEARFDRARIERGGLTITTSLDYDLQVQASCVMQVYMARLQGSSAMLPDCDAARLLPSLPFDLLVPEPIASVTITDPRTGQVLAVVGESFRGQETSILGEHDVGSLLTPFVYLTGFTRGLSPASMVWDIPFSSDIQNLDGQYHGPVRLRLALANDYFVPAVQVINQMGLENIALTAKSFGLELESQSSSHGTSIPLQDPIHMSLLDISNAYGVLAVGGVKYGAIFDERLEPVTVLRVESADHAIWLDATTPIAQPVLTPQLAYLINHILKDEPARWPSLGHPNSFEIGRPVGAKTGNTFEGQEAWAVGYTPFRVVTTWTGSRSETNSRISARLPAALWHALMQTASHDLPPEDWNAPAGITSLDVCDPSGQLPTADCPTIVNEVFANGSEPSQADSLYRVYEINRETGYLATVFTPPQLLEERVFMAFPPEARPWAEANGFSTPPDSYDAIQPININQDVSIKSPSMFADVRGEIEIIGTVTGSNLDHYRVLVGQGLNPETWIQVGDDFGTLVPDGTLAIWDTSELDGLYAVQLQAVRTNQLVDTAVIQVTVDNSPPNVRIIHPQDEDQLAYSKNRQITFQAQVEDNLSLSRVEFYINKQLIDSSEEPPFALIWSARRGEHQLRVLARDRAGNESSEEIQFTIK